MKVKNKFANICIAFTIITVFSSLLNMSMGRVNETHFHLIIRFVVTAIGISSLYIFEWLEHWPLRFVEILHYIISLGLVFSFAWLIHIFVEPIHPNGYRDAFWNYTAAYIVISIIYEVKMRCDIEKQNKLLKEITNEK